MLILPIHEHGRSLRVIFKEQEVKPTGRVCVWHVQGPLCLILSTKTSTNKEKSNFKILFEISSLKFYFLVYVTLTKVSKFKMPHFQLGAHGSPL
jgi:hypothetical protein